MPATLDHGVIQLPGAAWTEAWMLQLQRAAGNAAVAGAVGHTVPAAAAADWAVPAQVEMQRAPAGPSVAPVGPPMPALVLTPSGGIAVGAPREMDVSAMDDSALQREYEAVRHRLLQARDYPTREADEEWMRELAEESSRRAQMSFPIGVTPAEQEAAAATAAAPDVITPATIGEALASIQVQEETAEVDSLRPWEIFKFLPNNPSDGGKHAHYGALSSAWNAIKKVNKHITDADAALAKVGPLKDSTKASEHKKYVNALKEADAAHKELGPANAKFESESKKLKDYVKAKLGMTAYPDLANPRHEKSSLQRALDRAKGDLAAVPKTKPKPKKGTPPSTAEEAAYQDRLKQKQAAVDDLQGKLDTASASLEAKVAEAKAAIDAMDLRPVAIQQHTYTVTVGDAQARLKDQVNAYATVLTSGFDASAVPTGGHKETVPELLQQAPIGSSVKKILAIISHAEGDTTAVNTYDIADVTWGMVQWTTGSDAKGDLIDALIIIREAAPEAFQQRFARFGIDVDTSGLIITLPDGRRVTGKEAAKLVQSDPRLSGVMSAAGTDVRIGKAEVTAAYRLEVKRALDNRLTLTFPGGKTARVLVRSLITSEYGVGVLANKTVHAGFPKAGLEAAADDYIKENKIDPDAEVATWATGAMPALVEAITTGDDDSRIAAMKKQLDASPGTFVES